MKEPIPGAVAVLQVSGGEALTRLFYDELIVTHYDVFPPGAEVFSGLWISHEAFAAYIESVRREAYIQGAKDFSPDDEAEAGDIQLNATEYASRRNTKEGQS